jgi:hypothetical protein
MQGSNQTIPLAQAGVVYHSEELMALIRDLQVAFGSPPRYLRQAFKRSEDFWHKRVHKSSGGPMMSLAELFSYMNLSIHGVDCAVQHHVVAAGDLGEVHARPEDIKFVSFPLRTICLRNQRSSKFTTALRRQCAITTCDCWFQCTVRNSCSGFHQVFMHHTSLEDP